MKHKPSKGYYSSGLVAATPCPTRLHNIIMSASVRGKPVPSSRLEANARSWAEYDAARALADSLGVDIHYK